MADLVNQDSTGVESGPMPVCPVCEAFRKEDAQAIHALITEDLLKHYVEAHQCEMPIDFYLHLYVPKASIRKGRLFVIYRQHFVSEWDAKEKAFLIEDDERDTAFFADPKHIRHLNVRHTSVI